MERQEATALVAELLDSGHTREEAVQALCERTGWPRAPVERFVRQVERERQPEPAPLVTLPPLPVGGYDMETPLSQSEPDPRTRVEIKPTEDLIEYVVYELAMLKDRDDVVALLCEQSGWPWEQADAFIRRVEMQHRDKILPRRNRRRIALGVGVAVTGLLMVILATYVTLNRESVDLFGVSVRYLENIIYLITGAAMLLGGLAGTWRAVVATQR